MNQIYRLIWSHVINGWVAVSESSRGRGKVSASKLVAAALSLSTVMAHAGPLGGQVASGAGSVAQSGATTTINQTTQNLSLDWKSFNVGAKETVNFVQPSASAIAVNRIFDTNGSQILGQINANGQVYLINPNGILFGQGAQVNVGGLVASTLDFNDASLNGATRSFSGKGTGSVVNQGTINAASGGYVGLLGNTVSNTGTINAPLGTVAMGAGNAVTLNVSGNSLVSMQIDQSVLNSLVENGGLIKADGGKVFMNAGAKDSLLASVVNNTGVIEAHTVNTHKGTIILLAGMAAGTVTVGGTLDASAPKGGDGGFIETSGLLLKFSSNFKVTTLSATGKTGEWLIDPTDYTVAASGGDMTGAQLSSSLATNSVTVQSAALVQGQGDIFINDAVTWSSATKLTLNASRNIAINANITNDSITPAVGSLVVKYGQGDIAEGNAARNTLKAGTVITLRGGPNYSTILGKDGVQKDFTVLTRVGAETSTDGNLFLQGVSTAANLAGNYVLGSDLDATLTANFNGGAGFAPIGTSGTPFTGSFDGFGHTISNLTINRPALIGVGLFGAASASAVIANVGLLNATIKGSGSTGGLVGVNAATITNSNVSGSVVGGAGVGGLVGNNTGRISDSFAAATVTNAGAAIGTGGLVGTNAASAQILNSYATGAVKGGPSTGGLVGANASSLSGVYATGNVAGAASSGGLVGDNAAGSSVSKSYATGSVSGAASTGGLVGTNGAGVDISNSYATGNVSNGISANIGGLVGSSTTGNISGSYAIGNVEGGAGAGGLLGSNTTGNITNSYAKGDVTGGAGTGGLAGSNTTGNITNTYAFGKILSVAAGTGPLFGSSTTGAIKNSYFDNVKNASPTFTAFGTGLDSTKAVMADYVGFDPAIWAFAAGGPILKSLVTTVTVNATANNVTRIYDGQTFLGGNGVTYSVASPASGTYVTGTLTYGGNSQGAKNAGSYVITPVGLTSSNTQYVLAFVNGTLTITKANLAVTGLTAATNKVYNTDTIALLGGTAAAGTGVVSGDNVTVGGTAVGNFATKNAGTNLAVTVTGNTLGGTSAGNYTLVQQTGLTANVAKADLTVTGLTAAGKTYDATTAVALGGTAVVRALGADSVTVGGTAVGTLALKDVGTRAVTITGNTLGTTGDAGNYNLVQQTGLTAVVTKANLAVTGLIAATKTYNANSNAVLGGTAAVVALGTDNVTVGGTAVGSFATKNVGSALAVTVTGNTLGGTDGGNYNLAQQTGLTADVVKANLVINGVTIANKVYDGTTAATVSGTATAAALGTDQVSVAGGSGTAAFVDKNVGASKAVSISGFTLSGADAGNYNATGTSTATAAISRLGSVAWIGGTTGSWFDPTNWAGGAVPDLSNVANVVIPAGINVSFNDGSVVAAAQAGQVNPNPGAMSVVALAPIRFQTGPVNVDSIGSAGALTLSAGSLNVATSLQLAALTQSGGSLAGAGNIAVDSFSQTGGVLANTGNFTVAKSFAQSAPGTVAVGGNIGITQVSGPLVVSSISGNNVALAASSGTASLGTVTASGTLGVSATGDITQTGPIVATGVATLASATGDITLSNLTNDFKNTINASGKNIVLADANSMILGNVSASGTLGVNTAGNITQVTGTSVAATGASTLTSTNGDILLSNPANDFSTVNASGKNIALVDANNLVLGNVKATGTLGVNSVGNTTQATGTSISATGTSTLASTAGDITLSSKSNDLKGKINASGKNVALVNATTIILGDVTVTGGLTVEAVDGDVNQIGTVTTSGLPPVIKAPKGTVTVTVADISAKAAADAAAAKAAADAKVIADAATVKAAADAKVIADAATVKAAADAKVIADAAKAAADAKILADAAAKPAGPQLIAGTGTSTGSVTITGTGTGTTTSTSTSTSGVKPTDSVIALLQSTNLSYLGGTLTDTSSQLQSNNAKQNFSADLVARTLATVGDISSASFAGGTGTSAVDVTTTTLSAGTILQIASGGMRLPSNMVNETEEDIRRKKQ